MFSPVIQPVGEALSLIKLFLPLVLIVICSFDLLKIVISSKKEKGKNSFKSIIFRILYSICILLIPVAAMMFFNFSTLIYKRSRMTILPQFERKRKCFLLFFGKI
jgi:amino acid permease